MRKDWFGRRVRALAVAIFTTLLALQISAEANDPPVVTNGMVTPSHVTYLGGVVSVTAEVAEDSGLLNDVFVEVSGPYYFPVALSQGPGTNEWTGTVELPANYTSEPVRWRFDVRARDTDLQDGVGYAGVVEVDGAPEVDEPPLIDDPSISPRTLPSTGGSINLAVSAADLFGISQVYAVVTAPGGATTVVVLDSIDTDRFGGVFNAPPNIGATPVQYSVELTAVDRRDQLSSLDGGLITVAAAASQPSGRLKVIPGSLSFGNVKVGSRSMRLFVLRNDGKKSSAPVSGLLVAPGASFALVKGGVSGIPFTLGAGQMKIYAVEFRPTTVGPKTATLTIRRTDGQPNITVPLSGRGTPQR